MYYHSLSDKFPLLKKDIKNLTEEEREELLYRLNKQSEDIRSSFAILVARTLEHLLLSDTAAKALKALIAEHGLEELTDQIDSEDSIPVIMEKARKGKYWSFFNYELLAAIIEGFCEKTELIAKLEDYVSKFKVYCQHRVSEVPFNGDRTKNHCFKVKLDDIFTKDTDVKKVKKMQYKLQEILKMKPLLLSNVEGGCIELTFRYFKKTRLLPLSEAQKVALTKLGVQWLRCGEDKILLKKKTYTTPSSAPVTSSDPIPPEQHSSIGVSLSLNPTQVKLALALNLPGIQSIKIVMVLRCET